MRRQPDEAAEYISAAWELAAKAADSADLIERQRQLPDALAIELADRGFFRLLVPKSLDGAELDHPAFVQIVRIFAEADASTAWCINQNNIFATDSVRMTRATAHRIWDDPRAVVTNGPPVAGSVAVKSEGGYRLSGRWNFSSGSNIATWLAARAPVEDAGGRPVGSEQPVFLVPREQVTFLDLWHVNGLRGTASFSFEMNNVFVPEDMCYLESASPLEHGPLYAIPKIPLFAIGFATIAVALARTSLDDAIALAGEKTPRDSNALKDLATTHRAIGEAEAALRSADAYLRQAADELWRGACRNGKVSMEERIQVRLATTHAIRTSAAVVRTAYDLYGSDAIFTVNPVQRRFQD
ncbi:MAG: acyl-CoA dehydrogenase family protein, partial [Chloroflexi bacterium]|nr:acyl-CoA dehydrogenase family protein [Chloroflexota bacterium]